MDATPAPGAPDVETSQSALEPPTTAAIAGLAHMPPGVADRLVAVAGEIDARAQTVPKTTAQIVTEAAAETIVQTTLKPQLVPPPLQPPPIDRLAGRGELWAALMASMRALKAVGWISCGINVLMLAGPLFMLQVYDRVIPSGSIATLLALTAITVVLYAVIGQLELVRSRIVVRTGVEIDQRISNRIFQASLQKSLTGSGAATSSLRELDALRTFVSGPAPMTFFDSWWTPVYLLVIFLAHWMLGLAATFGAAILLFLAWRSETHSRVPLAHSGKSSAKALELAEVGQRNAEAITAMGMLTAYRARWQAINQEALAWQMLAADRLGGLSAISKTMRLLLQSLMLALGAALAVKGEISPGSIIAGTIIFGRALAPVEQAITHWRGSIKAYESYKKLETLLAAIPAPENKTGFPAPKGHIEASGLRVATPETRQLILSNLSFAVAPGQMLAVIGPSASGKSTLARALVGLWKPFAGTIKIDGVRFDQWDGEELGRHIGYLPQDIELFAGTVADNIARFRTDVTDDDVIAAAKAAHAHDLILGLPNAYQSELGAFGTHLSGGQRQRIALARALFGNPPFVVLDEPNANLDRAGDEALAAAIEGMRARGQAVIMISHRMQAIGKADLLLYLERGIQRAFGPRDEVMKMLSGAGGSAAPDAAATRPASAPAPARAAGSAQA